MLAIDPKDRSDIQNLIKIIGEEETKIPGDGVIYHDYHSSHPHQFHTIFDNIIEHEGTKQNAQQLNAFDKQS